MRWFVLLVVAPMTFAGCALLAFTKPLFTQCRADYRDERYQQSRQTDFTFRAQWSTPEGMPVDDRGRDIGARRKAIDAVIQAVSECTRQRIEPCGLRLKIAEKQFICGGGWVFPCHDPKVQQHISQELGCAGCWDTVEDPATMVAADDLSRLGHAAVHAALHLDHGDTPESTPWQFKDCGDKIRVTPEGVVTFDGRPLVALNSDFLECSGDGPLVCEG